MSRNMIKRVLVLNINCMIGDQLPKIVWTFLTKFAFGFALRVDNTRIEYSRLLGEHVTI